jgi:hypothetical protein
MIAVAAESARFGAFLCEQNFSRIERSRSWARVSLIEYLPGGRVGVSAGRKTSKVLDPSAKSLPSAKAFLRQSKPATRSFAPSPSGLESDEGVPDSVGHFAVEGRRRGVGGAWTGGEGGVFDFGDRNVVLRDRGALLELDPVKVRHQLNGLSGSATVVGTLSENCSRRCRTVRGQKGRGGHM